jgi:hypothetical protein
LLTWSDASEQHLRWSLVELWSESVDRVACGLRLDDEGFHPTVLVYWRNRIRRSQRPPRVFDAVREVVEATGVLAGRRRRVLDSTGPRTRSPEGA